MPPTKAKLALIDAHALIHRAYHALPPMSTRDGQPTNAVFGFTTMLLKMLSTLKPTHVVAAFDLAGPTFRHKEYEDYKAHRAAADDDLVAQFDVVREVVRAFNIPVLERQGFEADDLIGTLVSTLDGGVTKVIITGDKDTLQLIDDSTSVFTLKRGVTDTVLFDEDLMRQTYGYGPELVTDYKGLRGDPSDNIPGVEGIGDKTATELVTTYGTIEDIYEHLDELSKRAKTRLTGHKKDALFSRKLATIKRDIPLKFSLEDAELADYDPAEVTKLFERLQFRSLMTKLPKSKRPEQQSLFGSPPTQEVPLPENYHLALKKKEQEELRKKLSQQKVIAFDVENDRLGAREYPIVGMSFAYRDDATKKIEAWYVPIDPESVKEWQELLENSKIGKVGHNLKYDVEVLRQSGIELAPIVFDSMIGSYLLNPGARQHSLDSAAIQELGQHPIPITTLIGTGKDQKAMSEVPVGTIGHYAAEDADLAWQLYEVFAPKIKDEGLGRVFHELELPLIPVLASIELAGVALDTKALAELRKSVAGRLTRLQKKIWAEADEEFNINSTQQLRSVLYEKLQLPTEGISRTQSGFSTAARELAKLREHHAIVVLLEEYRELSKLQNTYIETLPEMVAADTGRIHASFNQTVAATGRLSSTSPNLQNIPVRTELGQEIRSAFVAPRGRRFIKADYSQLELRIAAHISGDEKMKSAFQAGQDIHTATAAWVQGIQQEHVSAEQRRAAKELNFGVLYGMGPQSFAQAAGISLEEARSFVERYREQYQGITDFIEATLEQARDLGFIETLFGRRRYVPEVNASSPGVRAAAERAAFNFPIQGTAADILKKAMIELHAHLEQHRPETHLVLTVHDELVCEAPAAKADEVAQAMQKIMSGAYVLDVPLTVDVAIGTNWRDLKPIT